MPILVKNIDLWWKALDGQILSQNPCGSETVTNDKADLIAWVILPDHIHMILKPCDQNLGNLIRRIKLSFAAHYRKRIGEKSGRVWQNRYWDHVIRNQNDLNKHIDYIHYNPVKHGLVKSTAEYPHSSFSEYSNAGMYPRDWGEDVGIEHELRFGE